MTPSYNQGEFIEKTILSILDQNYPNLEYIIIDGGSTDDTIEIIKKYESHITYWISESDKGQSHAINKGLKKCTGDIFNWLNSDDYLEPGALHKVSKAFEENEINVFAGRSRIIGGQVTRYSKGTDLYDDLSKSIGWARIDQPETFFRMNAIKSLGNLNDHLHYVMDKEWWIRYLWLFGDKGVFKSDEVLVNFRLHEKSKTISQESGFLKESRSLFYTLAEKYKLKTHADFIASNFDIFIVDSLNNLPIKPIEEVEKILNYHITLIFLEAYAQNNYKLAKKAYEIINPNLLLNEDKQEVHKVALRLKYLPSYIKKAFNYISTL
ncbi:MAG: glycosyltransferase family 2 protein [Bacteroidota bacterium]